MLFSFRVVIVLAVVGLYGRNVSYAVIAIFNDDIDQAATPCENRGSKTTPCGANDPSRRKQSFLLCPSPPAVNSRKG
jgi:hypothetical protein